MNARKGWRAYGGLVRTAAQGWMDDRAASMGAALSYYTVFSVAPLLLIVISLAAVFLGEEAARGAIVTQIGGIVGERGAEAIQTLVQNVSGPRKGLVGTVVGIALLLVGATTVFAELQDDLNRIWNAPDVKPPEGIWGWLRARVLSIGMIMAIGFLLLVSLVVSAAISALGEWVFGLSGTWELLAQAINMVASFAIVTVLFALIYRYLPQVHIRWHDVWIGAAVTAALFTIGKSLIGLYIGKSAVSSGFGAAGSLAVLLVWVYYSAQVFLFGAEFTWAFAHAYGSRQHAARTEAATAAASAAPTAPAATEGIAGASPVAGAARESAPGASPPGPLGKAVGGHPLGSLLGMATLGAALAVVLGRLAARRHRATRRVLATAHSPPRGLNVLGKTTAPLRSRNRYPIAGRFDVPST